LSRDQRQGLGVVAAGREHAGMVARNDRLLIIRKGLDRGFRRNELIALAGDGKEGERRLAA
jgi:hypothetical protein